MEYWNWESEKINSAHSFPGGASDKEPTCQCRRYKRHGFDPWIRKIHWRKKWQLPPVFLPEKLYGHSRRWATVHGAAESDTTEWPSKHTNTNTWRDLKKLHISASFILFSLCQKSLVNENKYISWSHCCLILRLAIAMWVIKL